MDTVRWNAAISASTDQSIHMFLPSHGSGRKGKLSRFIEEAIQAYILELTAEQAKSGNAGVGETDLTSMVDEAIHWARKP
ncbi:MAG: ribbon-helix-helix domain-containing protein [Acidithiobacillus sp.]